MLSRLRTNFKLAIISLFGVVALLAIVPFAAYRFASGNMVAGVLDLGILACIAAVVVYAWRGGNLERASQFVVVSATVGCAAITVVVGLPGLLWMYPISLANFMLTGRGLAFALSALALVFLVAHGGAFTSTLQMAAFAASYSVTTMFAYIFAHRTAQQHRKLEEMANHDALTGAWNRRALDHEMAISIADQGRGRAGHGLLVLDLDHFKRVNDRHGHEAGDEVLVDFVSIIQRGSRIGDRFYRLGGEEFVLLLSVADRDELEACADNLRRRVADQLRCRDEVVPITVSIGGALLGPREEASSWLARADAALYRAKRSGRNRVVIDASLAAAPARDPVVEPSV